MIAAPWFVLMQQKFPQFFHYFFIHQHFERFAEASFNNVQPWWFYLQVLAVLGLPWTVFAAARLVLPTHQDTRSALRQLTWLWLAVIVVFFSLPASKLIGYALPATPAIAMLAAGLIAEKLWPRPRLRWLPVILAAISGTLILGGVYVFGRDDEFTSKPLAAAWRAQARPGEPLISLRVYRFDMPVYAQLPAPIPVVLNWQNPDIARTDSWPRELADAAVFDPQAGARVLLNDAQLPMLLCAQPVSWIVAAVNDGEPLLANAEKVAVAPRYQLLRFDRERSTLSCKAGQKKD